MALLTKYTLGYLLSQQGEGGTFKYIDLVSACVCQGVKVPLYEKLCSGIRDLRLCSGLKHQQLASIRKIYYISNKSLADPIVSIPNGKIRGTELKTNSNKTYFAFWNIPYGKPPLGRYRFQAAEPAESWTGIRDGTQEGNSCIYMNLFSYYPNPGLQDEDCLYISVYTPDLNVSSNLPVMFWIYGGGFRAGSGIYRFYGPQNLIDENVIVVTFNYRLGPLGFLSTGDHVIPGNAGLKDQLLALQWTKNYIKYFGGNPEMITIFGESAGGMSVGLHLVSEKSKGLFRAAICHSGCTLSTTLSLDPKSFIYNYTNYINPNITEANSTEELRSFLINVEPATLMSSALQVEQHLFVPVLEPPSDEAFITEPLFGLVESGKVNGEALLIGTNSEESLGFISQKELLPSAQFYDKDMTMLLPAQTKFKSNVDILEGCEFIKNMYLSDDEQFQDNLAKFLGYYSDDQFVRASFKQIELQSQYQKVYGYRFSFYGTTSKTRDYIVEGAGKVGHFTELSYLFNMTQYPLETEADDVVRRKFAKLWTNFATYLDLAPEETPLLDNVILPKSTPEFTYLLNIDTNLSVLVNPQQERMKSWTKYWEKFVQEPFITF